MTAAAAGMVAPAASGTEGLRNPWSRYGWLFSAVWLVFLVGPLLGALTAPHPWWARLTEAVRKVAAGLRVVDPALATQSLLGGNSPLSARERDVLRLALEGHRAPEIARRLFLSAGTVRNHLSSAIAKTHATSAVEAAREAQQQGWL